MEFGHALVAASACPEPVDEALHPRTLHYPNVAGRPGCGQVHESVDDPDDSYREKCSRNGENGNRLRGAFVCCPQYLLRILSIV